MATLSDIKRRINSVKNTQQITRAMKMVAAAKLRRAQEDIVAARPYADKIQSLVGSLSGMVPPGSNLLFQKPEKEDADEKRKVELLFLTSDKGLCGGFNTLLIRAAENFIAEHADADITLNAIGKRGGDHFRRREGVKKRPVGISRPEYSFAKEIAAEITDNYLEGRSDEVYVVYSEFVSALTQEPVVQQILPVTPPVKEQSAEGDGAAEECLLEPSAQKVLDSLLPKYIEVQIFRSLLETAASEHGARMTSMDSASRNAADMIDSLTLIYNRVRQAAITKELMEIISGAESLKG